MKRVIILIMIFILTVTTTSYAMNRQNNQDSERRQKIIRIINSSNKVMENRTKIRRLSSELRDKVSKAKARTAFLLAHKDDLTLEQLEKLKEVLTALKSSDEVFKNTSGNIKAYNAQIKNALNNKDLDRLITIYQEIKKIQDSRILELTKINKTLDLLVPDTMNSL